MRVSVWGFDVPVPFPLPQYGHKKGAVLQGCILQLSRCMCISVHCRESLPYPSLRLGSELVSVKREMMLGSAEPEAPTSN